mgnify:CR=1 FL=1|jgi:hypothetical protein
MACNHKRTFNPLLSQRVGVTADMIPCYQCASEENERFKARLLERATLERKHPRHNPRVVWASESIAAIRKG